MRGTEWTGSNDGRVVAELRETGVGRMNQKAGAGRVGRGAVGAERGVGGGV